MDFEAQTLNLVRHYAAMARNPGAVDHARFRVQQLEREHPQEFAGLAEKVRAELKGEA